MLWLKNLNHLRVIQKQPLRGVPGKRCSENMQKIYRRTSLPKCDFNKVALQLYWSLILGSSLSDSVGTTWIDRMHVEASYHHMLSSHAKNVTKTGE